MKLSIALFCTFFLLTASFRGAAQQTKAMNYIFVTQAMPVVEVKPDQRRYTWYVQNKSTTSTIRTTVVLRNTSTKAEEPFTLELRPNEKIKFYTELAKSTQRKYTAYQRISAEYITTP